MARKPASNIFFIIFFVVFLIAFLGIKIWQMQWKEAVLEVAGEQMHVIVARSPSQWYKGLSGRKLLDPFEGMLFLFGESKKHIIVMREMKFPIDILWIANGHIVDIVKDAPLEQKNTPELKLKKYIPLHEATAVLEIPSGTVQKKGFKVGDTVRVPRE